MSRMAFQLKMQQFLEKLASLTGRREKLEHFCKNNCIGEIRHLARHGFPAREHVC